ncbi:MAG TPA: YdeI/OmpD-associated family protein [Polyangiaceae bacterium]|nr:YdeI/OmpD-associated family protein [Polyangiaceae bacterium]
MTAVRFTQRIRIRDINPYLRVSAHQATALKPAWKRPMPVLVTINGQPSPPARVNLMPAGDGTFYLYLNGPIRAASATAVGDSVTASVSFDASYRGGPTHPMPASLRRALALRPKAKQAWTALPPSRQKEILRYLAGLKSDAARERNVTKVVASLGKPGGTFLGRAHPSAKRARR